MRDSDFIKNSFISEAKELLERLELQLLELEKDPSGKNIIDEIFRITHTFKGSSGMVGFNKMGELAHDLENVYDAIREGTLAVTCDIISTTLRSADMLSMLLTQDENLTPEQLADYNTVLEEIRSHSPAKNKTQRKSPMIQREAANTYFLFIYFKPGRDIFKRGLDPFHIFEDLSDMGAYKTIPPVTDVEASTEQMRDFNQQWAIILNTSKEINEIKSLFLFYKEDEYKFLTINPQADDGELEKILSQAKGLQISSQGIASLLREMNENTNPENSYQETIKKESIADANEDDDGQENPNTPFIERPVSVESVRVPSKKLDELINLVSELIIINSQLAYLVEGSQDIQVKKTINTLEKLYKQLRNNALELRLVPVKKLTLKFQRLVRDLSRKLNKNVDFETVGTDTELDSNIINKIEGPLMHIIRNSLDHGIEDEETRVKQGKSPKGIIRFISFYSGANVFVQVQDDGRGIDKEYIRKKAIEKGIINPTDKLTNQEIYDIIFLPGFSTAQSLTEVSGRGVGMDVVKKSIQELRGSIEIDSENGLGTSVSLKLPLTLSIIDTLLVKVNDNPYLLPLSLIDSCYKINHSELLDTDNRHIRFKDQLLPYIYLRDFFELDGTPPEIENLVILEYNEKKYGLVADKVIGEYQAVVKPLGPAHKTQEYLTGAGILGDGSLALILDTNKLVSNLRDKVTIG